MATVRRVSAVFLLVLAFAASMNAQQIAQAYISNEGTKPGIQQLNFATGVVTMLYPTTAKLDDMLVNSAGQVIYTTPSLAEVSLYDPHAGTNTVLTTSAPDARDLIITPNGANLMIAGHSDPAAIYQYNFSTKTLTTFVAKNKTIKTYDGLAYDAYGNFYAVANNNTIIQINPTTGATINTLTIEPHSGINGADGLCYDSFTNSLWATHDGKTSPLGFGLVQIPVQPSGFASTTPGYTFFPLQSVGNMDGIKSDGKGNLYISAIWTAQVFSIKTSAIVASGTPKGADGIGLVPGTF